MPIRLARAVLALAVVGAVIGFGAALWWHDALTYDLSIYRRYGEAIAAGQLPYRDFRLEYPPGALPVFAAPALITHSEDAYRLAFAVEAALLEIGVVILGLRLIALLGRTRTHTVPYVTFVVILAALPLGSVALTRFDFWPALLLLCALGFVVGGRTVRGGVVLGVAIATKIYPVVIAPLLVLHAWRRGGLPEARRTSAAIVGATVAVFAPFALLAPRRVASSLWEQLGRPLQIESLGAAAVLALHKLFGVAVSPSFGHGSYNLSGSAAAVATVATEAILVLVLAALWMSYAHGPADGQRLVTYSAAAVVAFVAMGKVLSPQFLLWLIPLVPLVRGRRGVVTSSLLALAAGLTVIWIPFRQVALVSEFASFPTWALVARNTVLVAIVLTLVIPLLSRTGDMPRQPSPGHPGT